MIIKGGTLSPFFLSGTFMPVYNFKKRIKLYVVYAGLRYKLDIYPDISFSQTFEETEVPVKTLHQQLNMFSDALITKANPLNFSFTIPALGETDMDVMHNLLLDYDSSNVEVTLKPFDIYVETDSDIYKLEYCVLETGTFQITRNALVTLSLAGTGRKLSRYAASGTTIPGTLQTRSANNTYIIAKAMEVSIGGAVQASVSGLTLEIQNSIEWVDYTTIHKSLDVTNAGTTQYPGDFVVSKRQVTGTIVTYVTELSNNTTTWSIGGALRIRVGNTTAYNIDFNIPSVVYTNRVDIGDLITQAYDWRMTSNPTSLSTLIVV
jgi:hypothetical protein